MEETQTNKMKVRKLISSSKMKEKNINNIAVQKTAIRFPPIRPSKVLLGLVFGNIFLLPIFFPT